MSVSLSVCDSFGEQLPCGVELTLPCWICFDISTHKRGTSNSDVKSMERGQKSCRRGGRQLCSVLFHLHLKPKRAHGDRSSPRRKSMSLAHSVISTARETRGTLGEKLGQPESKSSSCLHPVVLVYSMASRAEGGGVCVAVDQMGRAGQGGGE